MTDTRATPVVSVVIITYNHRPYIEECLASVLSQDLEGDWEVIVADDASTDGTTDILLELAASNPRLAVLTTPTNLGVQKNLRRALSAATAEFVATLEGDDYWTDRSKLRRQSGYLRQHAALAAVGHLTEVVSSSGCSPYRDDFSGSHRLTLEETMAGAFPHLSSLVFRRELLPTTPLWSDGIRGADWLMCCLLAAPHGIGPLPNRMSCYRVNDESTWAPLPFAERRLDHLRQLHALDVNSDLLPADVRRVAYRKVYSLLYSGIARTPGVAEKRRLMWSALRVSPRRAAGALPLWAWSQMSERIRQHGPGLDPLG